MRAMDLLPMRQAVPKLIRRSQLNSIVALPKPKKSKLSSRSPRGVRSISPPDDSLTFSFKFFDASDARVCPPEFRNGYTQSLMARLKSLSTMRVSEFYSNRSSSLRAHPVDWSNTSRPDGFSNIGEQFEAYTPYQFSISSNADGRVFGFLIDACFYVVWLDSDHSVYRGD